MRKQKLYVWLGTDPLVSPPDRSIDNPPGVSDLDLVAGAIRRGDLGRVLPAKMAISAHQRPGFHGYRSIDVARLLRDYEVPHRRCYEIVTDDGGHRAGE